MARNVRLYRKDREPELTYAELSRQLDALGRRIPPLGLRQLEAGQRRVDVDDLLALAQVFDVSPMALMMPHHIRRLDRELPPGYVEEAKSLYQNIFDRVSPRKETHGND